MTRPYRKRPSTNTRTQQAVDRFSAAVQGQTQDTHDATGALLEALANATQFQITQAVALLMEHQTKERQRLDEVERKLGLHQRHIHQIDLVLDEQARERAVGD